MSYGSYTQLVIYGQQLLELGNEYQNQNGGS
jgi:hypothetical protein